MEKKWNWPERLKAAGMHLFISGLVALAAAALVLGVWYPMPYREVSGGRELFTLIVSVDVVLGPLITLAVFSRSKPWPEMRRDFMVIGLLQLAALGYGLYTVAIVRPVYVVHEVDRFRAVRALDLAAKDLSQAPSGLQRLSWTGPQTIGTRRARDEKEFMESIDRALAGEDVGMRPNFWRPYDDQVRAEVRTHAKPLTDLKRRHPQRAAEVDAVIAEIGLPPERLGYLPLMALKTNWVLVVDTQTAEVVGQAPFDGFE